MNLCWMLLFLNCGKTILCRANAYLTIEALVTLLTGEQPNENMNSTVVAVLLMDMYMGYKRFQKFSEFKMNNRKLQDSIKLMSEKTVEMFKIGIVHPEEQNLIQSISMDKRTKDTHLSPDNVYSEATKCVNEFIQKFEHIFKQMEIPSWLSVGAFRPTGSGADNTMVGKPKEFDVLVPLFIKADVIQGEPKILFDNIDYSRLACIRMTQPKTKSEKKVRRQIIEYIFLHHQIRIIFEHLVRCTITGLRKSNVVESVSIEQRKPCLTLIIRTTDNLQESGLRIIAIDLVPTLQIAGLQLVSRTNFIHVSYLYA